MAGYVVNARIQEAIDQLSSDAQTFQDRINERTSDPEQLAHLASVAIEHLDGVAASYYMNRPVVVSGTVYEPVVTSGEMPDIGRAGVLPTATIEGMSQGFYYYVDTVDVSSWHETHPAGTLEDAAIGAEPYCRVELGHLIKSSTYRKESFLGTTETTTTKFAPVSTSRLRRLEDIAAQEIVDARAALTVPRLAEDLDDILLDDSGLRLDRLDVFFRRLILSPKYSHHIDSCLRYANALIGANQAGIEVVAEYACVADTQGNFGVYTFSDALRGQYDGLCLTIAYYGKPQYGLRELKRPQVGIRVKYADKDDPDNLVIAPLSSIQALAWIESPFTSDLPEYARPRRYGNPSA